MDVLGRDTRRETYRIALDLEGHRVLADVPEHLFGTQPSHQSVYEGLARNRATLTRAIAKLVRGHTPKPPYDQIHLIPSSV